MKKTALLLLFCIVYSLLSAQNAAYAEYTQLFNKSENHEPLRTDDMKGIGVFIQADLDVKF